MSNLGAVILKEVAKEDVHYDQQAITTLETCLDVDVSRLAASASGRGNRWRVESTRDMGERRVRIWTRHGPAGETGDRHFPEFLALVAP